MNRKIVFDAVRRMLGRGFTIPEVRALDQVLDEAMRAGPDIRIPSHGVSLAGIRLIKAYEGCARLRADGRYEAYPDPGTGGAPWTIGWGSTGADVRPGIVWTKEQCDRRLEVDIARHATDVERVLGGCQTSQAQFDALVSFHFNTGAIGRATLTKFHCQGEFDLTAAEFGKWRHAGGRVLNGLVRRRREEAKLYRSGGQQARTLPMD